MIALNIYINLKMSIDILGRHSKQAGNSSRGPPGIRFMVTSEGNFDKDGKRLCNVAKANSAIVGPKPR